MKMLLLLLACFPCSAAMQFDGTTSELLTRRSSEAGAPLVFSGSESITIGVWLKRYSTNTCYFLNFTFPGSPQTEGTYSLKFNSAKSNCVEFSYEDDMTDATHVFSSQPNVGSPTNVWMHIGFTYHYSFPTTAQWWVNGLPVAGSWTTGNGANTPLTTSGTLHVGCNGPHTSFFNGEIGELQFYWNTIFLQNNQMVLLSSRVKNVALQLRTQDGDGASSQNNPCVYWPLNQIPALSTLSTTSTNINDISHYGRFLAVSKTTLAAGGTTISRPEQVCSYPPNE